ISNHVLASLRGSWCKVSASACAPVEIAINKPATNTNGAALATTSFKDWLLGVPEVLLLHPSRAPSPLCRIHAQIAARFAHNADQHNAHTINQPPSRAHHS